MEKLMNLDGKGKNTYGKGKIWKQWKKMKILNRTMTNRCEKGRESRWKSKIIYGE